MIRNASTSLPPACARAMLATVLAVGLSTFAAAQTRPAQKPAAQAAQKPQQTEPGKPVLIATIGDWGVYVTSGGAKQCYALAQPKERAPKELKRDPAYFFITTKPAEKVKNEVSIIMGFDVKTADKATPPKIAVGPKDFRLDGQGGNLWPTGVSDPKKPDPLIEAMRGGAKMTVKVASLRGNVTTDSYSLTGLGGALDRVQKECP